MRIGWIILLNVLSAQRPATPGGPGPAKALPLLRVSPDGHFLETEKGAPFFWLGDTGWLLLGRLTTAQAEQYFDNRHSKGFNVIQVMVVHNLGDADVYGHPALSDRRLATPTGKGYWEHLDSMVDLAARKGLYLALVPVWGGVVKSAKPTPEQARAYASFLAARYTDKPNIVWINGGDIRGADDEAVWNAIGATLREKDPHHLITFHPRGRASSSFWFEQQPWLDFNSVQSGHRSYAQDTSAGDPHYGEDNWRYIRADYAKRPVRPVLDAEPSYEQIPHGLHDTSQPRWTAADVRRYAYWSVFAGACGFTYGDNSVMQFLRPTDKGSAYGARAPWFRAIDDPGAGQMQYLEKLMLSRGRAGYFARVPDTTMVTDQGSRYDRLLATRGPSYAFIYTYTGREFHVNPAALGSRRLQASWYNPRDGSTKTIGVFSGRETLIFDPPGNPSPGNDWVLILDDHE
ncbi:MAG TPA: glycoside hydrolase family 140 protein [Puia sp.]|nr:glycoside hydrolase family 140 protein [Puia sp.]